MAKQLARTLIAVAATLWLGGAVAQEHHDHHRFAPDVDAFHAVLAPVWHARPGKERARNACAKTSRMASLVNDIRSADASALRAAVVALQGTCKGKPAGVDGALHDVHEAFHRLIEPGPGK